MDFEEYTNGVLRTEGKGYHPDLVTSKEFEAAATLFMAAGDLLDVIKKSLFYGKAFDRDMFNIDVETISTYCNAFKQGEVFWDLKDDSVSAPAVGRRHLHSILGLATESSELIRDMYNDMIESRPVDKGKFTDESGDLFYYLALGLNVTGVPFEAALKANRDKLSIRYPEAFDAERAKAPDKAAEMVAVRSVTDGQPSLDARCVKELKQCAAARSDKRRT